MRMHSGLIAAVLLAVGPVPSNGAAAKLPPKVAAELKDVASLCRDAGGKPITHMAVKRGDLNGDGFEDYVLDVGSLGCDGAASIYGDREKAVMVFVGDGKGGAVLAFSGMSYGVTLTGKPPALKLWLAVTGGQCGKKPARDFASENFCDRPLVWNGKSRKFDFAPVSQVRMIQ